MISLDQRQADYDQAERDCMSAGEAYVEIRAAGRLNPAVCAAMDWADELRLRRAKRRLEAAQHRELKRAA